MKKLIIAVCMLCVLAFSAVAGASAESNALSSEQKAAEKLFGAISGKETVEISTVCSPALAKKFDAKALTGMKATVADKLGTVKSNRLFSYERFGKADRLVYLGSFSKEKLVRYIVVFSADNPNLITEFAMGPVQPAKQEKK